MYVVQRNPFFVSFFCFMAGCPPGGCVSKVPASCSYSLLLIIILAKQGARRQELMLKNVLFIIELGELATLL